MGHSLVTRGKAIAYHRCLANISWMEARCLPGNQSRHVFKDVLRPWASAFAAVFGLPSWARTMGVLKHHGFSPVTVFDIGVAYGTFPLYAPSRRVLSPDRSAQESLAHMQRWTAPALSDPIPWHWATMTERRCWKWCRHPGTTC